MNKFMHVLVILLWIVLLIFAVSVISRGKGYVETFADPSTIPAATATTAIAPAATVATHDQCLECATYFSGIASLPFGAADTDSAKQAKVADYANHQSAIITYVLAAIQGFVQGSPLAGACKTKPTDPSQAYYDCMRDHVTYSVSCDAIKMNKLHNSCPATDKNCTTYSSAVTDCQLVTQVIDDVIAKASICSSSDCSDVAKYPKAQEQEQCKETSICKTVADLDANIMKVHDDIAASVAACALKLTTNDSDCVKHFLDIVAAKQITSQATAGTAGLGSQQGADDTTFDISSMIISNTA